MDNMKLGRIKIKEKFPSLDKLFESYDKPYLYNFEEYIVRTGIFDLIKDDFDENELRKIDLTQIEKEEQSQYNLLFKKWRNVIEEAGRIETGKSMKYTWKDLDYQREYSSKEFKRHWEESTAKKNRAIELWKKFIEKINRLYKKELIGSHRMRQSFDSYFIHVPEVQGSSCECKDNISSGKKSSFSIELIGGLGGVKEISVEEGLTTIVENGKCCKIEITAEFLIKIFKLYRMGKKKEKQAQPELEKVIAIAPVTLSPNEDTCGWSNEYLRQRQDIKKIDVDTKRFKSGLIKRTLKLKENLQTKGGISLKVPSTNINTKVDFTLTNISEKHFIYTLPKGHVYTYYTVPNTIGYSWTIRD